MGEVTAARARHSTGPSTVASDKSLEKQFVTEAGPGEAPSGENAIYPTAARARKWPCLPGGPPLSPEMAPARPPPSPRRADHIQHRDEECLMNKHYLKGLRNTMNFSVAKNSRGLIKKCMNFVFDYKSRAERERERNLGGLAEDTHSLADKN